LDRRDPSPWHLTKQLPRSPLFALSEEDETALSEGTDEAESQKNNGISILMICGPLDQMVQRSMTGASSMTMTQGMLSLLVHSQKGAEHCTDS
jgi:hypothetical protein